MMGKIFGEFQTYNIGNELNKHLDRVWTDGDHDRAFTWSDVKQFLGYHTNNDGLMNNDYPKEKLSKEQQMYFRDLRRNKIIQNKYNELIEKRKQIQKQEEEQLEQERQERQRQDRELRRQDMVLGFYR